MTHKLRLVYYTITIILYHIAYVICSRRFIRNLEAVNFNDFMNTKEVAVVLFYSDGCQSCQEATVEFLKANRQLQYNSDVQFGKVNINKEHILAMRYHVDEVPVIKIFPYSVTPINYYDTIQAEKIMKSIKGVRLQGKLKRTLAHSEELMHGPNAPKHDKAGEATGAIPISSANYENIILSNDTYALLALYTPECGKECRIIDEVGKVFQNEDQVVIGKMNVEIEPNFAKHFMSIHNPTLLWFHRGKKKQAKRYAGEISKSELVAFLNDHTGSQRTLDGTLEEGAGRIYIIEQLVANHVNNFITGHRMDDLIELVKQESTEILQEQKYVDYYIQLFTAISAGKALDKVMEDEQKKLQTAATSSNIKRSTKARDEWTKQYNILSGLVNLVTDYLQAERVAVEEETLNKLKQEKMKEEPIEIANAAPYHIGIQGREEL